jgi:serine phosphatase RsbU (regulator of sigma subunit)
VVSPDGGATTIGRPQPPVGTIGDHAYTGERVHVAPGSLLLFFTDGLVERRGDVIDDGIERVAEVASEWAGRADVEAVADDVLARLKVEDTDDDLALVVVRIAN